MVTKFEQIIFMKNNKCRIFALANNQRTANQILPHKTCTFPKLTKKC